MAPSASSRSRNRGNELRSESSAPRLYVESLNTMIDMHTTRLAPLADVIPEQVLDVQLFGGAVALGVLAVYLRVVGRGGVIAIVTATMISIVLVVIADLDRPERGFIHVPATSLDNVRASMQQPPALGP